MTFTPEFKRALDQVLRDYEIDGNNCSELVSVGVSRRDCLELLQLALEDEPNLPVAVAVAVQWAVATGVWIERNRATTLREAIRGSNI